MIEARRHIEVPAAGYAAERHSAAQLTELREIVEVMKRTSDLHEWVALDGSLHRAIAEASGNPVLASMTGMMRQALDPQSEFLNITKARQAVSDIEHDDIVEAIASRRPAAAETAAAHHIAQVANAIESASNQV